MTEQSGPAATATMELTPSELDQLSEAIRSLKAFDYGLARCLPHAALEGPIHHKSTGLSEELMDLAALAPEHSLDLLQRIANTLDVPVTTFSISDNGEIELNEESELAACLADPVKRRFLLRLAAYLNKADHRSQQHHAPRSV